MNKIRVFTITEPNITAVATEWKKQFDNWITWRHNQNVKIITIDSNIIIDKNTHINKYKAIYTVAYETAPNDPQQEIMKMSIVHSTK